MENRLRNIGHNFVVHKFDRNSDHSLDIVGLNLGRMVDMMAYHHSGCSDSSLIFDDNPLCQDEGDDLI